MNGNESNYSHDWLIMLYERLNEDFSLTRNSFTNTHQWIITLAIGAITAIIAFGKNDFKYPTEISLAALLVMIPLVFRFYVRSCLEYTLFNRTLVIRQALDEYLRRGEKGKGSKEEEYLYKTIDNYYFGRYSAKSFKRMIWDNLMLAFLWPSIVLIGLVIIGLIYQEKSTFLWITISIVGTFMIFEIYKFFTYDRFTWKKINK